jgi:hypothetical protein
VSLVVEDEIMVLLRPAPGALPDPLPNDDRAELTFGSWNRRMVSILVEPATAGAGLFDLTASWVLDVNHDLTVDVEVGVSAELSVNTTPTGNSDNPVCIIWDIQDSCEHSCATDPDGAVCGDAIISGQTELLTCNAGHDACETPLFEIVFPAVPLMPGDEIMVLLRPAPGALPELPTNDDFLMVVHAVSGVPASSRASIVILLATVIGIGIAMTKRRRGLRVR